MQGIEFEEDKTLAELNQKLLNRLLQDKAS